MSVKNVGIVVVCYCCVCRSGGGPVERAVTTVNTVGRERGVSTTTTVNYYNYNYDYMYYCCCSSRCCRGHTDQRYMPTVNTVGRESGLYTTTATDTTTTTTAAVVVVVAQSLQTCRVL